jgi:GTPase SAR1 family protein
MKISSGIIPGAKKIVLYGPEGIGKTTFMSHMPEPVFIDTEGGTKTLDVKRFDIPKSWSDIKEAVKYVLDNPGCCKTLVIDTADWAELLCMKYTCQKGNVSRIEDFGYGKGYTYLMENFKELLDELEKVIAAGVNVAVTAHAKMRKFEQPDEMGAYDRWEMKLSKQVAPMIKEWADIVLFANYKTYVIEDDKTKSKKAQGGKRVMYCTHNPCWDAKNRYGLPDCVAFDYAEIKQVIEDKKTQTKPAEKKPETPKAEAPKETPKERADIIKLRELMEKDGISENRLLYAVLTKSDDLVPATINELDPEFVQKSLIDKWDKFVKYARKISDKDIESEEIPFK